VTAVYETLFAPVSPAWRTDIEIAADLNRLGSDVESISAAQTAQIEMLVKQSDEEFRQLRYQAALAKYKEARARIYQLTIPTFEVSSNFRAKASTALRPTSEIESQIQKAGIRLIDAKRPTDLEISALGLSRESVDSQADLGQFTKYGFQETRGLDHLTQEAAVAGVAFLLADKPASSVAAMEEALAADRVDHLDRRPGVSAVDVAPDGTVWYLDSEGVHVFTTP